MNLLADESIDKQIVLIRLAGLSSIKKSEIVISFITKHYSELMESFSVITSVGIRIRRQNKNNSKN